MDSKNLPLARELIQDGIELINIDEPGNSLSPDNVGMCIPSDALTYFIYTSGTTGEPKAVVQNHVNVIQDVMMRANSFRICAEDRVSEHRSESGGSADVQFTKEGFFIVVEIEILPGATMRGIAWWRRY